jgi:hypothetical protein
MTIVQVVKCNELFYLLKNFDINGSIGIGLFSTTNEPKGSRVGKRLQDFNGLAKG